MWQHGSALSSCQHRSPPLAHATHPSVAAVRCSPSAGNCPTRQAAATSVLGQIPLSRDRGSHCTAQITPSAAASQRIAQLLDRQAISTQLHPRQYSLSSKQLVGLSASPGVETQAVIQLLCRVSRQEHLATKSQVILGNQTFHPGSSSGALWQASPVHGISSTPAVVHALPAAEIKDATFGKKPLDLYVEAIRPRSETVTPTTNATPLLNILLVAT